MSLTLSGTVTGFLFASLVFYLIGNAIDIFVSDAVTHKLFKVILIIICLVIAFGLQLVIH